MSDLVSSAFAIKFQKLSQRRDIPLQLAKHDVALAERAG